MIITIESKDGRMREFNTNSLCASDPWSEPRIQHNVICTEFDLRTDKLPEEKGLRLDIIRHIYLPDASGGAVDIEEYVMEDGSHPVMPATGRIPTTSVLLASEGELKQASIIYVSSGGNRKPVAWRQGSKEWLVNGISFESTRRLYYTDSQMTSISAAAIRLFQYIRKAYPQKSEEEIAREIGFDYASLQEVISMEAANNETLGTPVEDDVKARFEESGTVIFSQIESDDSDKSPLIDISRFDFDEDNYDEDEDDE